MVLYLITAGKGQEHGQLLAEIINHQHTPLNATYTDVLPWFIKPYLHSMEVTPSSTEHSRIFQTAHERGRPTVIQLSLTLPPHSTVRVYMEFDKAFLRYTEHRPDAHRGFDIPPAVLSLPNRRYLLC